MTDIEMFDCLFYYLHERRTIGKKQRQAKIWYNGKAFYYKYGFMF